MIRKSLAVILALVITVTWIGMNYAQESAGPILRIVTYKAAPGNQEELMKFTGEEIPKLYAEAKGLQWYKIYYDPSTSEFGTITIWDSQADVDAYTKSEARKAAVEKMKSLIQGDISTKVYQVYEPKK